MHDLDTLVCLFGTLAVVKIVIRYRDFTIVMSSARISGDEGDPYVPAIRRVSGCSSRMVLGELDT